MLAAKSSRFPEHHPEVRRWCGCRVRSLRTGTASSAGRMQHVSLATMVAPAWCAGTDHHDGATPCSLFHFSASRMMPGSSSPRARQHATRAIFMIPGIALAVWAALVPFAKARGGMDEHALGLVLLCLGVGSLVAMPLAGALAMRLGNRRVLLGSFVLMCVALPGLALAVSPWWLALALFLFGAGMGSMDCVMNLQAVVVERESGRALMSNFHAFYSIGGFVGAGIMAVLLSAALSPLLACLLLIAAMGAVVASSVPHCLDASPADHDTPAFAVPRGVVVFLGILCFITFLCEGTVLDWSAVFLHEIRHVPRERAGIGFALYSLSMTAMRLFGNGLAQRLGQRRTLVLGGMTASIGFLIATLAPHWLLALPGYVLVGAGCAHIVPILFTWAGQQKAMPESLAIPAVTTLGYAGILVGPALIGFVADSTSLITAFIGVALAMLGLGACIRWVRL